MIVINFLFALYFSLSLPLFSRRKFRKARRIDRCLKTKARFTNSVNYRGPIVERKL